MDNYNTKQSKDNEDDGKLENYDHSNVIPKPQKHLRCLSSSNKSREPLSGQWI